jgi:hypothetical protein
VLLLLLLLLRVSMAWPPPIPDYHVQSGQSSVCAGNAEAFGWPGLPAPRRRTETAGGAYAASEGVASAAVALSNLEPSSLQWRAGSCGKADRAVARTETWTSETRDRGGRVAVAVAEAEE